VAVGRTRANASRWTTTTMRGCTVRPPTTCSGSGSSSVRATGRELGRECMQRAISASPLTSRRSLAEAGWCREACCVISKYMPRLYCEVHRAADGVGSTPSRNAEFRGSFGDVTLSQDLERILLRECCVARHPEPWACVRWVGHGNAGCMRGGCSCAGWGAMVRWLRGTRAWLDQSRHGTGHGKRDRSIDRSDRSDEVIELAPTGLQ
jgi:hypothetical protein